MWPDPQEVGGCQGGMSSCDTCSHVSTQMIQILCFIEGKGLAFVPNLISNLLSEYQVTMAMDSWKGRHRQMDRLMCFAQTCTYFSNWVLWKC